MTSPGLFSRAMDQDKDDNLPSGIAVDFEENGQTPPARFRCESLKLDINSPVQDFEARPQPLRQSGTGLAFGISQVWMLCLVNRIPCHAGAMYVADQMRLGALSRSQFGKMANFIPNRGLDSRDSGFFGGKHVHKLYQRQSL